MTIPDFIALNMKGFKSYLLRRLPRFLALLRAAICLAFCLLRIAALRLCAASMRLRLAASRALALRRAGLSLICLPLAIRLFLRATVRRDIYHLQYHKTNWLHIKL